MSLLEDRRKLMMSVKKAGNIGSLTPTGNILNLIYHIEQKDYVSGEFVLDDWLKIEGGKTLIFDTGLLEINGLFLADADYDGESNTEYTAWSLFFNKENPHGILVNASHTVTFITEQTIVRGTVEIKDGKFYVTPFFNNTAYTPLYKGHRYVWIAW